MREFGYRVKAFHCCFCGAPTKEGALVCEYCDQKLRSVRYNKEKMMPRPRLLVDCGLDYVNFNQITGVQANSHIQEIDVSYLEDTRLHMVESRNIPEELILSMTITDKVRYYIDKLMRRGRIKTRLEYGTMAWEQRSYFAGYMTSLISVDKLQPGTVDVRIVADEILSYPKITPKNEYCPNCGAPIKSRYGACDYCGGWVEYDVA